MHRVERLTGIVLLLQERPRTAEQIAAHFAVSRRTVLRDVQALCEIGVPVIAREGVGGGFSLPAGYAFAPPPLSAPEAFLLLLAIQALGNLTALPNMESRASLVAKLRSALSPAQLATAEPLLGAVRVDTPTQPRLAPFLDALIAAAHGARWVCVEYQSAERQSAQHLLPRALFTQNGLWYCRAFAADHTEERTYRVDRICALAAPDAAFQPPPTPDALPYGHESHPQVSLSLSPRGAALLESEPHLGPQLARRPDGSAELAFRCPPAELDYYARLLAGFGADALVHEPPDLRQKLRALGENLVDRYGE